MEVLHTAITSFARIRPLSLVDGANEKILSYGASEVTVQEAEKSVSFDVDHAFGSDATQTGMFQYFEPVVDYACLGNTAVALAFGPKASGKTTTLMGRKGASGGLIYSCLKHLLTRMKGNKQPFVLRLGFLEQTGKGFQDLIADPAKGPMPLVVQEQESLIAVETKEGKAPLHDVASLQEGVELLMSGMYNITPGSNVIVWYNVPSQAEGDQEGNLFLLDLSEGKTESRDTMASAIIAEGVINLFKGPHTTNSRSCEDSVLSHFLKRFIATTSKLVLFPHFHVSRQYQEQSIQSLRLVEGANNLRRDMPIIKLDRIDNKQSYSSVIPWSSGKTPQRTAEDDGEEEGEGTPAASIASEASSKPGGSFDSAPYLQAVSTASTPERSVLSRNASAPKTPHTCATEASDVSAVFAKAHGLTKAGGASSSLNYSGIMPSTEDILHAFDPAKDATGKRREEEEQQESNDRGDVDMDRAAAADRDTGKLQQGNERGGPLRAPAELAQRGEADVDMDGAQAQEEEGEGLAEGRPEATRDGHEEGEAAPEVEAEVEAEVSNTPLPQRKGRLMLFDHDMRPAANWKSWSKRYSDGEKRKAEPKPAIATAAAASDAAVPATSAAVAPQQQQQDIPPAHSTSAAKAATQQATKLYRLQEEYDNLCTVRDALEKRCNGYEVSLARKDSDISTLQQRLRSLETKFTATKKGHCHAALSSFEEYTFSLTEITNRTVELKTNRLQLAVALHEARVEAEEHKKEIARLQECQRADAARIAQLEREKEEGTETISDLEAELKEAHAANNEHTRTIEELRRELCRVQDRVEDMKGRLQEQQLMKKALISPGSLDKAIGKAFAEAQRQLPAIASSDVVRQMEYDDSATPAKQTKKTARGNATKQQTKTQSRKQQPKAKKNAAGKKKKSVEQDVQVSVVVDTAYEAEAIVDGSEPVQEQSTATDSSVWEPSAVSEPSYASDTSEALQSPSPVKPTRSTSRRASSKARPSQGAASKTPKQRKQQRAAASAKPRQREKRSAEAATLQEQDVAPLASPAPPSEPQFSSNLSPIRSVVSSVAGDRREDGSDRVSPRVALRRKKLFGGNSAALSPTGDSEKPPRPPVPAAHENGFRAPARRAGGAGAPSAARKRRMIKPGLFKGSLGLNASSASNSSLFGSFREGAGFRIPKLKSR